MHSSNRVRVLVALGVVGLSCIGIDLGLRDNGLANDGADPTPLVPQDDSTNENVSTVTKSFSHVLRDSNGIYKCEVPIVNDTDHAVKIISIAPSCASKWKRAATWMSSWLSGARGPKSTGSGSACTRRSARRPWRHI